jgi:uncharacterized membrane protein
MRAESVHAALLVLIAAGLGLSAFAAFETYYPPWQRVCSVSKLISCSAVDESGHTKLGSVPDWFIGLAGFVALTALDVRLYSTWRRDLLQAVVALSGIGLVVALYLGYVELAIIHALCPVCFSIYVVDGVVFLMSLWLLRAGQGSDGKDDDASEPDRASPGPSPRP